MEPVKEFCQSGVGAVLTAVVIAIVVCLGAVVFFALKPAEDSSVSEIFQTEPLPWVENAITQPLPENASSTRLSLPAKLEDLMPDGAPITGFGAHLGQHAEGLDHVWIAVKKGEPARAMGDGTVTNIGGIMGHPGKEEYMIYIDYGDGLMCSFGEISKPLVEKGQKVKYFDPVGEIGQFYGFDADEIEIYCADSNRSDGVGQSSDGYGSGAAVSPFDYLNEKDKSALELSYKQKVLDPTIAGKDYQGMWSLADPYLTNKLLIHENNKIIGEWFLIDKEWNDNDYSLVVFLPGNQYYDQTIARLRIENANLGSSMYIDAPYEVLYEGNLAKIVIETEYETLYALAEVVEDAGADSAGVKKARMKFEIGRFPISTFSSQALSYQERGYYNPRYDAWKMGNWVHYR